MAGQLEAAIRLAVQLTGADPAQIERLAASVQKLNTAARGGGAGGGGRGSRYNTVLGAIGADPETLKTMGVRVQQTFSAMNAAQKEYVQTQTQAQRKIDEITNAAYARRRSQATEELRAMGRRQQAESAYWRWDAGERSKQQRLIAQSAAAQRRAAYEQRQAWYSMRASALDMSYILGRIGWQSGIALAAVAMGVKSIASAMVDASAKAEDYQTRLGALFHNMEMGKSAWAEVKKFAVESPLTFEESIKGVTLLMNLGEGFGDIMRENTGLLETFTKVAVFSGRNLEQIVRAMERLKTGHFYSRELYPAGVTPAWLESIGLKWDAKKGTIAGLSAATGPGIFNQVVAGLTEKLADYHPENLLRTMLTNIQDVLFVFWSELGTINIEGSKEILSTFRQFIADLTDIIKAPAVAAGIQDFTQNLLGAFKGNVLEPLKEFLAGLGKDPEAITRVFNGFVGGLKALVAVFVGANIGAFVATFAQAIATLILAFSGGPGGAIGIAAILAATALGFMAVKGGLDKLLPPLGETNKGLAETGGNADRATGAIKDLVGAILEAIGPLKDLGESIGDIHKSMLDLDTSLGNWNPIDWYTLLNIKELEYVVRLLGGIVNIANNLIGRKTGAGAAAAFTEDHDTALLYSQLSHGLTAITGSSNIGALRLMEAGGRTVYPPGTQTDFGDEEGAQSAADLEKELRSTAAGLLSGKSDIASAAASAALGRTDKLCAATVGEYLKMWGFKPPQFANTGDVLQWLSSVGAEQVTDIQPGDVIFSADKGGIKGLPDHVAIATAAAKGGMFEYIDQFGTHTRGTGYANQAWRIPSATLSGALGGPLSGIAPDPFMQQLLTWQTQIAALQQKLIDYTMAGAAPGMLAGIRKDMTSTMGGIWGGMTPVQRSMMSTADQTKFAAAFNEMVRGEAITEFEAAVADAASEVDRLAGELSGLRDAISGLQDAFVDYRASRAEAMGLDKTADSIRAQGLLNALDRANADYERFKSENAGALAANNTIAMTQLVQLEQRMLGLASQGYGMAAGLRDKEGATDLYKALFAGLESKTAGYPAMYQDTMQIAGDTLITAGIALQQAAADLAMAAGALAGAKAGAQTAAQVARGRVPGALNTAFAAVRRSEGGFRAKRAGVGVNSAIANAALVASGAACPPGG